jgi:hypothetical protein
MTHLAAGYRRLTRRLARLLQRHPLLLLSAFTLVYFAVTSLLAWRKLVWYDEIYTIRISQLPTLADVWAALGSGMDPNPPLNYLATRVACSLLGDHPLAYRLPAIVGFWLLSLCLYAIVSRRCGRTFGCLAALFAFATSAHSIYAYEARPYGLLLGFSGLAVLCWQRAAEGRRVALLGLALSLAAAVSTHYYAVLVFVPLGLAELARAMRRRRLDLPMAAALAAGLAPLLLYYPVVQQARAVLASGFWAKPKWESVAVFYQKLLEADLLPCVAVLLFLAIYPKIRATAPDRDTDEPSTAPPIEEVVLAVAFAVLPFFGIALAKLFTGAFSERYVIPAVIGLALAFAYAACHYARGCQVFAVSVGVILLGWWLATDAMRFHEMADKRQALDAVCRRLSETGERETPLVVSDSLSFMQLTYYAPDALRSRLTYLNSPELSLRYKGYDTDEVALRIMRKWVPLNVVDYEEFVSSHRRFLVYDRGSWLPSALVGSDWDVRKRPNQFLRVHALADAVAAASPDGDE